MQERFAARFKEFASFAAPALKDAFKKGAKVFAFIVLSAALESARAYIAKSPFDPTYMVAINLFLASAQQAIDSLQAPAPPAP